MKGVYIKKITALGSGKTPASIDFKKGFNLIIGPSNTGKTCIANAINFVFGANIDSPFSHTHGYDEIVLELETNNGSVKLTRKFNNKKINVISSDDRITSKTYTLDNFKKKFLRCIGIEEDIQLIKNSNFGRQSLTWRVLSPLYYIDQTKVGTKLSILLPEQKTAHTGFKSALLFMLTGNSFDDLNPNVLTKELKEARKKAISDYLNKKIQDTKERISSIESNIQSLGKLNLEIEIKRLLSELKNIEDEISTLTEKSGVLFREITLEQKNLTSVIMDRQQFTHLQTQYNADVARLSLIINGEHALSNAPATSHCPFCDNKLSDEKQLSYENSAYGELERIITNNKELENTIKMISSNIDERKNKIDKLKAEQKAIAEQIKNKLQPKADEIRNLLDQYHKYIELKKEKSILEENSRMFAIDLTHAGDFEDEDKIKFKPSEHYSSDFVSELSEKLQDNLSKCSYPNLSSARFSLDDFDVHINGEHKVAKNGMGYRSLVNSILSLSLREILATKAKYDPGFIVIDSPTLGLDEEKNVEDANKMKAGLFGYLIQNQKYGQTIILENKEHVPKDIESHEINIINFTGNEQGRTGFLYIDESSESNITKMEAQQNDKN